MAIENETADQVVRMILQGSEVVLRLSGAAAMRIATMIYTALKDDHTSKGKATLWEFMKSGKDQKLFSIPDSYLKAFTTASKKFGFPFVILKDKSRTDGLTDIMVYATDASKVNRVLETLRLTVKQVETLKPEVKMENGELIKPLGMQYAVPLELIDNIPDTPKHDKRLLAELQKYASKMKQDGPQVVEPVGLLCKPNGRYQILPGQGAKRLVALRLAGYKEAVADIMVPKKEGVEVRAENIDERPAQERSDDPKLPFELDQPDDNSPTKEEGQTANPTMARTSKDPASGQDLGKNSTRSEKLTGTIPEERPSVRKELERCKEISDKRQTAKQLMKDLEKFAPPSKIDAR
ncbi:MAG: PcfB family protein [Saccharofermentans sp.]|nr:PcfB family protein [Saccharofermentans sp.]